MKSKYTIAQICISNPNLFFSDFSLLGTLYKFNYYGIQGLY